MSFSKLALGVLRVGIGIYLIFTAIARVFAPGQTNSVFSLYASLGLAPMNQGAVYYGITAFLAVLGVLLLAGRLIVLVGFLVFLLGLANGVSEVGAAIIRPLTAVDAFALLNLGFRDLLVLAPVGLAIMAFDSQLRRRAAEARRGAGVKDVTMFPPEPQPKARVKLPEIPWRR